MGTELALKTDRNMLKNSIALVNTADYEALNYIPHKVQPVLIRWFNKITYSIINHKI